MNDYKFVLDWDFIRSIIWTVFIATALMTVYVIGGHDKLEQLKWMETVCKQVGSMNVMFDYNNSAITIRPAVNTSAIKTIGIRTS